MIGLNNLTLESSNINELFQYNINQTLAKKAETTVKCTYIV